MRTPSILIGFFFLLGCKAAPDYVLNKSMKVLSKNESCDVVSYYPVLSFNKVDSSSVSSLNIDLEGINEMDRYSNCLQFFPDSIHEKVKRITGNYSVLFESDSLLSVEYLVNFEGISRIEYRSVFINLVSKTLQEPHNVMPNINRELLYPYVKKFSDSSGVKINMLAYHKNSSYQIMYGRTKSDLVLYVGKEGEFGGNFKILIPLKIIGY